MGRHKKATERPDIYWATRMQAAIELTQVLGRKVTVRAIDTWTRDGAPVPAGGGEIEKIPLLEWIKARGLRSTRPAPSAESLSHRDRREKGEADKIELVVARMKSELVPKAEYDAATRRIATLLRDRLLLELPPALLTVYTTMPADEAIDRCRVMIGEILSTLGDADSGSGPDPEQKPVPDAGAAFRAAALAAGGTPATDEEVRNI
jgi:hypothetical protein